MKFKFNGLALALAVAAVLTACGGGGGSTDTGGASAASGLTYKVDGVAHTEPTFAFSVAAAHNVILETGGAISGNITNDQTSGSCSGSAERPAGTANTYSFTYSGNCGRKIVIPTNTGNIELNVTVGTAAAGNDTPTPVCSGDCMPRGNLVSATPVYVGTLTFGGVPVTGSFCEYTPSAAELAINPNPANRTHLCP